MSEDDIYGNKARYEKFIADFERLGKKPSNRTKKSSEKGKKNHPHNLIIFFIEMCAGKKMD